jgi:Putative auto-transporter adhesin, head GIN domain
MSSASTPVRPHRAARRVQLVLTSLLALLGVAIILVLWIDHHSSKTIVGSGVAATQSRSVPPFSSVDATGVSNLSLHVGPRQSVVVSADDNIVSRVTTRVVSGTLVVGNKSGSYSVRTPIVTQVVVPSVAALTLEGSGDISASGINSRALTLSLAGVGTIRASGTTARLRVTISGAGDAQLAQLRARDATAFVNGDGDISVTATNSLQGTIAGSGTISYRGNPPHVTSSVTGNGEVTPG